GRSTLQIGQNHDRQVVIGINEKRGTSAADPTQGTLFGWQRHRPAEGVAGKGSAKPAARAVVEDPRRPEGRQAALLLEKFTYLQGNDPPCDTFCRGVDPGCGSEKGGKVIEDADQVPFSAGACGKATANAVTTRAAKMRLRITSRTPMRRGQPTTRLQKL